MAICDFMRLNNLLVITLGNAGRYCFRRSLFVFGFVGLFLHVECETNKFVFEHFVETTAEIICFISTRDK